MLLIQTNGSDGKPRILTLSRATTGKLAATLRIYNQKGMTAGVPQGELVATLELNAADMAELKAAL